MKFWARYQCVKVHTPYAFACSSLRCKILARRNSPINNTYIYLLLLKNLKLFQWLREKKKGQNQKANKTKVGPNCSHFKHPCVFIICVAVATSAARSVSLLLTCYQSWPGKCGQRHNKSYASSFNLSKHIENFVSKRVLLDLTAWPCQVSLIIADRLRGVGTSQRKYSPKYFTAESVSQLKDRSCWLPSSCFSLNGSLTRWSHICMSSYTNIKQTLVEEPST